MISSTILIVMSIILTTKHFFVNEILLLENNFWSKSKAQAKTKKEYLNSVTVEMLNVTEKYSWENLCIPSTCYYDNCKRKFFYVLSPNISKNILMAVDPTNVKQGILKFNYTYTNFQNFFYNYFSNYERKIYHYDNYKVLIKETGDTIKLDSTAPISYICHIKQLFEQLFDSRYVILDDIELDENHISQLPLLYFNSLSSCFESLKNFVNFLNRLKLFDDDLISISEENLNENDLLLNLDESSNKSDSFITLDDSSTESEPFLILKENKIEIINNCIKKSSFKRYLQKKFDYDYKEPETIKTKDHESWKVKNDLFGEFCDVIINLLSNNDIILPVKGSYNLKFYLDQFYEFIKEKIEENVKKMNEEHSNIKAETCYECRLGFVVQILSKYKKIINDAWESLNISAYFSILTGKEIHNMEDYLIIDKIMCDYLNMMHTVTKLNDDQSSSISINFAEPMYNDHFECRIIKAIEISFEFPIKLCKILAYDSTGKDIVMKKNVDYFVRTYKRCYKVSLPFENIRKRNVHELEILSTSGKFRKRFLVYNFLNSNKKKVSSWNIISNFILWIFKN